MLHKQPPERPLLHLHLVSEIVHLASHKYQQSMDLDLAKLVAKRRYTFPFICFLSHFSDQDEEKFLTRSDKHSYFHIIHIMVVRMKRSSWQEVSNTTGCLPRCSHTRYTWKLRKKSKVIHSSNINLEVRKTVYSTSSSKKKV